MNAAVQAATGSPLFVQVGSIARRSVTRTLRQPALIVPAILFPMILLAINAGGLESATKLPGFPTDSYLTFAIGFTFVQGGMFAIMAAGTSLAEDRNTGFFNRLQLTPMRGSALLVGQLAGVVVLGLIQALIYLAVGLTAGGDLAAGVPGAFAVIALGLLISLALGSIGLFAGVRASSGEAVQGLFPLMFVFLFMSSMSMPRDLIKNDWFQTVATLNPMSYLIEAMRSLFVTGWDAEALALGVGFALLIFAIAVSGAAISLKNRMVRT